MCVMGSLIIAELSVNLLQVVRILEFYAEVLTEICNLTSKQGA